MMRSNLHQHGVTLLELLLALATGALLMTAVLPLLTTTLAAANSPAVSDQADLERQATFATERIARIVRAKAPAILTSVPGLTGMLAIMNYPTQDPATSGTWFSPATFKLTGTAAPFTLVEQRDGDATLHVLADSVDAFSIVALPVSDGRQLIKVDLTLKKNDVVATASTVVRMGWLQ